MTVLSLFNPFGWFGGSPAKLSGGQQPSGIASSSNWAGRPVTPETALSLSAYWACVKIIAQTIGTLSLDLFQVKADGSRILALDHPLYDLLHDEPYDGQTSVEFWEGVGACLAVWGNAYALKHYVGPRLVALELLRPIYMSVTRRADASALYRYSDPLLGAPQVFTADQLFHVRGFGFGDVVGLSPLAFNRNSIGTAIAADEAAGTVFRNGLRVAGWFKFKGAQGILKPEQREDARRSLVEPYQGAENAGKVGILPGDFDWVAVNMNPSDAQLLDNRKLNVEEICRCFGVPPVLVGHIAQGQTMWGSGIEHIVLAFMTTGLRPYLHRIEAAIGRDIIGRAQRKTFRATFNVEELMRGDNKGMAEVDQSLANTGINTRNEIRARRGLPPKPGGDTLTVQSALLPIDMLGKVSKLPKDKEVEPGADVDSGPVPKG